MIPLPTELIWRIYDYLDYKDIEPFTSILPSLSIEYLQQHYPFHHKVKTLLLQFEKTPDQDIALDLLHSICDRVSPLPYYEQRHQFTQLLDTLQTLIVERVLDPDLSTGCERHYADLCLSIRTIYLHTSSIRVLHDSKYRRRSTKYPLAPFLPRDYTYIWRDMSYPRDIRIRFSKFFGPLFAITSLYLESNLEGTYEECVREALVSGNVEDLFIMTLAAKHKVDIESMCLIVTTAREQLQRYLETIDTPSPERQYRLCQQTTPVDPPEWMIPDRYVIEEDTLLRLKVSV
ncbi:hypothetical protein BDB01DRAFT_349789 [Pilobolus umbonatus]|nr:hypothetical protein BDB01DRAFT_349789 [Pilobolus umbonatus]